MEFLLVLPWLLQDACHTQTDIQELTKFLLRIVAIVTPVFPACALPAQVMPYSESCSDKSLLHLLLAISRPVSVRAEKVKPLQEANAEQGLFPLGPQGMLVIPGQFVFFIFTRMRLEPRHRSNRRSSGSRCLPRPSRTTNPDTPIPHLWSALLICWAPISTSCKHMHTLPCRCRRSQSPLLDPSSRSRTGPP